MITQSPTQITQSPTQAADKQGAPEEKDDPRILALRKAFQKTYGIVPPLRATRNVAQMDLTLGQQVQLLEDLRRLAQLALDHVLAQRRSRAQAVEGAADSAQCQRSD